MTSLPRDTAAAPAATATAPIAAPMPFSTLPSDSNLPLDLSAESAALSISSPISSALSATSSISRSASSRAALLRSSSLSMSLRVAVALFSWIRHCWVLRSFSPKDSAALARAERSVSIFCFWASISLFSTWFLAVRASTELSFLSNWDCTTFISEPRTLKDFLNSFSPSRPIFRPKSSAI